MRYDGGHARDRFVSDVLGRWVEWQTVCPEVDSGLGTPRPAIRLVDDGEGERVIAPSLDEDYTESLTEHSRASAEGLGDLDGFVLKRNSPSCGLERLRVYFSNGHARHKNGIGVFARSLTERWPQLPVEEEGRLNDPRLRENFIERVFCRNRWRVLVRDGLSREALVAFHTAHKLLIRSHDERGYRRLGRIAGSFGTAPDRDVYAAYEDEFQRTLCLSMTTKKHVNVLEHSMGYLKRRVDAREKRELMAAIGDYRMGLLPLIVPLTLLRFSVVKHEVEYLQGQLYFEPHPKELMLRNHV